MPSSPEEWLFDESEEACFFGLARFDEQAGSFLLLRLLAAGGSTARFFLVAALVLMAATPMGSSSLEG